MRFVSAQSGSEAQYLARADVVVAASNGQAPAPQLLLRAMAGGAVLVASRLPEYEETLDDGDLGLLFEPRDVDTLAAQIARLAGDSELRSQLAGRVAATHARLDWSRVADEFEQLYADVAGRRHAPDGKPDVRKRLQGRDLIHVDLHMHTNHSHDCATPVERLLETAKARGLGAIACTA